MKTSHVTIMSIAAALALVTLAGVATTQAQTITPATDTASSSVQSDCEGGHKGMRGKGGSHGEMKLDLTEDQQAALQTIKESKKSAVESAVIANNFEAFVDATESAKEEVDAYLTANGIERPARPEGAPEREEPTDAQKTEHLQAKFDKMVDYYAENGELPTFEKGGMKKMRGMRGVQ